MCRTRTMSLCQRLSYLNDDKCPGAVLELCQSSNYSNEDMHSVVLGLCQSSNNSNNNMCPREVLELCHCAKDKVIKMRTHALVQYWNYVTISKIKLFK